MENEQLIQGPSVLGNQTPITASEQSCAQSNTPICNSCQNKIFGEYVYANGASWHFDHFKCKQCEIPLTEFAVHDGQYYCKEDYFKEFGTKCKKCNQIITEAYISALNSAWHKIHWTCSECSSILDTSEFYEVDGNALCRNCYAKEYCPTCEGCHSPVVNERVISLGKNYHLDCFKCFGCGKIIGNDVYFLLKRQPHCEDCFK